MNREQASYAAEEQTAAEIAAESVSTHPVTLIEMSPEFKAKIIQGYAEDPRWTRIQEMITKNAALLENAAVIPYRIVRQLIYYTDIERGLRLCIPRTVVRDVFRLAHNKSGHLGYNRTHEKLSEGLYIYNMAKELRAYIGHCPECQLRRTPRHPVHGSLQPILTPPRPFHTISIDFILALPKSNPEGYDCAMSVTCKFSKAITIIPGNIAAGGKVWAAALLDRLCLTLWGLPRAILSDRDPRFVGQLWRGIFEKLGVSLLYSTSYHPQTDGASERTNQTVEIALRYYLATLPEMDQWPTVLPRMSQALCNSTNFSSTGKTPTEVLFGFRTREALDFLRAEDGPSIPIQEGAVPGDPIDEAFINKVTEAHPITTRAGQRRQHPAIAIPTDIDDPLAAIEKYRPTHVDAKDAIAFAAMKMKQYYDSRHTPTFFKEGDYVNLRLHRGYTVPSIQHKKIDQQFVGPFKILQRVGRLAYRLELPKNMRIHNVISVAHLERATPPGDDPYQRPRPQMEHPLPVLVEGQPEYEIEKLLRRRRVRKGHGYSTEYLVRWLGWGPEADTWYNVKDLGNARDLVRAFKEAAEVTSKAVLP